MNQFVHLHLHTQYSLLDGVNKLPHVLQEAFRLGQPAIAMTDHGNMHGAIEFYQAAKDIGIKPIIGCEMYLNPVSRHERKTKQQGGAPTHHLTVLAKNMEGYNNLCKLVTLAYREGFYFKPRIDHELLAEYSKGLIVLSGCLQSELAKTSEIDDIDRCREIVRMHAGIFGEDYYLEVQPHPIEDQQRHNNACIDLAKDLGIPLVATTDCHYLSKDDHFAQEVLMCVSTGKTVNDPDRIRHEGVDLHLKTYDEMIAEFKGWSGCEEAVANSVAIAEKCDIEFDFSTHFMPQFDVPEEKTLIQEMTEIANQGLIQRLETIASIDPEWSEDLRSTYQERLDEEIDLIDTMGFAGYFLVVADFINWAKENDIPVGPGRGSAAGSLVAYCMRITEVDPIKHKLLFERFLNPARVSLPDIDVDFCIYGRDLVIKYVIEKYGKDHVAQIATFGTLKAKAAIKDVGRALGISYAETDRVAQLVPAPRQGFDYPLAEAIKMEPRLKEYAEGEGSQLISLAMKLEGLNRHTSTHAAGVVIGDRPLTELLPLMVDKDGNDVTQYSMKYVEKIGLVKFDFLGLKTLTVIHKALEILKGSQGITIDPNNLSLDDAKTYKMVCSGNLTGVFQLESSGITEMTMRLRPNCFDDLVAILALYRPGPLDSGMAEHYIKRKHGQEQVEYLHPLMQHTLSDTYGIILYQEQIMQLARELAGYSLGEADLLRRAMGKKVPEEMAQQRTRFTDGAQEKGLSKAVATEIFDQMETFARYGFNRSHSAAYAMISYQTAYLKTHFPVEFMAALMSEDMGDSDKTLKNFTECRKNKIAVLPPDVNHSISSFSVRDGKIRYGLSAVKGVGEKAVAAVIEAREEDGDFSELEDFVERVDLSAVNKKVVENFVKSGAFDFCSLSRREMLERVEEVIRAGQALQRDEDTNQISLFGESDAVRSIPRRSSNRAEWPVNHKLALERDALGFYISGHPLDKFSTALTALGVATTTEVRSFAGQESVRLGGVVTALRLRNTKKGDRYASFILEDSYGTVEALVWPDVYNTVSHILTSHQPVVASGRPDVTEERCVVIINQIESLIGARDRNATRGIISLSEADNVAESVPKLREVFKNHNGPCPLKVRLRVSGDEVNMILRDNDSTPICVQPSEELCDKVEQLFGRPILTFM